MHDPSRKLVCAGQARRPRGRHRHALRLVIDLDAMARNLATMAAFAKERGLRLRPHAKTHKSAAIAKLQDGRGCRWRLRSEAERS